MTVMPVDPHDKQRVIQLNFVGRFVSCGPMAPYICPAITHWLSLICTLKRDMHNLLQRHCHVMTQI